MVPSPNKSLPVGLNIDPGFVHHRKVQTILGDAGMSIVDKLISGLPQLPEWQRLVRIDHIYKNVLLDFCRANDVKTLEGVLATEVGPGTIFCSTEELAPCPDIYEAERTESVWVPRGPQDRRVVFQYSTKRVAGDTLRSRLFAGSPVSIIGELSSLSDESITFDPLVMGFPWLETADPKWKDRITWWGTKFFQNAVEDFDEFVKIKDAPEDVDIEAMKAVPEKGFKNALTKLLGDRPTKDWGGETSDHFTSHLHLAGRSVTAAFLLKGPAHFAPMGLNHLGKNNDQIVRLASEPAEVLFVQHCHDITAPVRSTLHAFAVQPGNARHYCLMDGRDSLRLLLAYDLYELATNTS